MPEWCWQENEIDGCVLAFRRWQETESEGCVPAWEHWQETEIEGHVSALDGQKWTESSVALFFASSKLKSDLTPEEQETVRTSKRSVSFSSVQMVRII